MSARRFLALLTVAGLAGAGCGGGGGPRLKGAGSCNSAARSDAGIKGPDQVPDRLAAIVRRVVLARSAGVGGEAPSEDLVACVADAYRRDATRLSASYLGALQDWASLTSNDLAAGLAHGDITDAERELSTETTLAGRDIGYMAAVLAEAGKVAGDGKEKTESLLDRFERCPRAMLFVAFRNQTKIRETLLALATAKGQQAKALEDPGLRIYPKSGEDCSRDDGELSSYDDGHGAVLSLTDLVLSVTGRLVEGYEQLYRTDVLDRLHVRD